MTTSLDRDHFFQTTASNEDHERKQRKSSNTYGAPVKFSTKILALDAHVTVDQDVILVAEAGGIVSALTLSTNKKVRVGNQTTAPLTSLASFTTKDKDLNNERITLFAGCWNKQIIKYNFAITPSDNTICKTTKQDTFSAHSDFVKCLAIAPTSTNTTPILISGGADSEVKFWNTNTNKCLATLRPDCRGIESIAIDPYSAADRRDIFFSTSQREIFHVQMPTSHDFTQSDLTLSTPILAHETSVYKLFFDSDGDLWTASADKTAKRLLRESDWKTSDTTLTHPDFVRDVVVHERTKLVVTACRDEEIRVWDCGTAQLRHTFSGHFEEVTSLAIVGDLLISVSIDTTVRRWSMAPGDLAREIERAKNPVVEEEAVVRVDEAPMLTEEEEVELRALMEDEEEESLEKMAMDQQ